MYSGKDFEEDFRKSFTENQTKYLTRLYDTTNGFTGVRNPCDFILYSYPNIAYLELKVTNQNRLSFSNITPNQWESLTKKSCPGQLCGILVNYAKYNFIYFIDIDTLNDLKENGYHSVGVDDMNQYGHEIKMILKRTRYTIDVDFLMNFIGGWR